MWAGYYWRVSYRKHGLVWYDDFACHSEAVAFARSVKGDRCRLEKVYF